MTSEQLLDAQLEALLSEHRAPCAFVKTELCSTLCSPSQSKFYGVPYTPGGFQWPTAPDGGPLRFVGQINMQELRSQAPNIATMFPREGVLQFYAAGTEFVAPYQRDNWRVIWHAEIGSKAHESHPNAIGEKRVTWLERSLLRVGIDFSAEPREQRIMFNDGWCLPSFDILPYMLRDWPNDQSGRLEAFFRITGRTEREGKLLGYAHAVQYDPRIEALFGAVENSATLSPTQRGELIRRDLNDWQLLWQIPNFGYHRPIAVGGYYLVIRKSDLLAGNLSEALAVSDID